MKTLVAKLTGREREEDPINIHKAVFWITIVFWLVATGLFALVKTLG